jgi:hypothetical protein
MQELNTQATQLKYFARRYRKRNSLIGKVNTLYKTINKKVRLVDNPRVLAEIEFRLLT